MALLPFLRSSRLHPRYDSPSSISPNYPFPYFLLFLFTVVSLCIQPTRAGPNVTVDDTDPRIVYTGFWERTPNFEENSAGGGHVTAFNDPTASVTFTFRGTAVYLSYPLWPYKVSSGWVSLDGQAPSRVSLQDPNHSESDGGRATAPSSIMVIAEGLDPELDHTIRVTASQVPDEYVVFDMLMYTAPDNIVTAPPSTTEATPSTTAPDESSSVTKPPLSSNPSPIPSFPSTTSSVARSSASTSVASRAGAQSQTQTVTIAVCVIAAILVLLAIPLTIFFCKRRRQRKEERRWRQENQDDYNAAYPSAEAGITKTPIHAAHTTFHTAQTSFPQTPGTYASFESMGYVVPSPTALDPTYRRRQGSKDDVMQNDPYMEQIRRNHSHMVAAKSSMGSMAFPVTPPAVASTSRQEAQRPHPQPWNKDREFAPPVPPQRRAAIARRQRSGDSGLSYVSENATAIRPISQVLQPTSSAVDIHSRDVGARDRELELEVGRQEREQRQRLKLRIRNARSTMMTVDTVSLPPAYEDPSYTAPPPIPPQPKTLQSQVQGPSSSSPDAQGPGLRSADRGRRHASRRVTQASTLLNPWDDAYGGMSRSVEDDFDGRTLVGTLSPMRENPSASPGYYMKSRLHTLAPASG